MTENQGIDTSQHRGSVIARRGEMLTASAVLMNSRKPLHQAEAVCSHMLVSISEPLCWRPEDHAVIACRCMAVSRARCRQHTVPDRTACAQYNLTTCRNLPLQACCAAASTF